MVEQNIFENQTNNRLFDLLLKTLYLYSYDDANHELITNIFELKFLSYIGYKPSVLKCTNCGNNNLDKGKFSMIEGGILCNGCIGIDRYSIEIDPTTLKLIEYILENDIVICNKIKVSKYILNQLDNILKKYLMAHIENLNLKSLNFLKNLKE